MATGSKSARIKRAEGLAFLTSAMSWIGPGPAKAARKSRTGGASAAWVSSSSSGIRRRAATTSRRFAATISSSMVVFISLLYHGFSLRGYKNRKWNESSGGRGWHAARLVLTAL